MERGSTAATKKKEDTVCSHKQPQDSKKQRIVTPELSAFDDMPGFGSDDEASEQSSVVSDNSDIEHVSVSADQRLCTEQDRERQRIATLV